MYNLLANIWLDKMSLFKIFIHAVLFLLGCDTLDTTSPHYGPQIPAVPGPSPFTSCIANADEAAMINLRRCRWKERRSPLNRAGFTARVDPLCRDHRERHQTSGTNTLV